MIDCFLKLVGFLYDASNFLGFLEGFLLKILWVNRDRLIDVFLWVFSRQFLQSDTSLDILGKLDVEEI